MSNFNEMKPSELTVNPFQAFSKDWMLITAEKEGRYNTMTASWGALGFMWAKNVAFIGVRPQRYTKEFIDGSDTFSLSFFGPEYKKELSYLGKVSGRDEDKISKSNLTVLHEGSVPYFEEAKTIMICKKLFHQSTNADSFIMEELVEHIYPEKDFHVLYVGEIQKILVKED
jgi:flavin reductase (DIM6/NTAB) family NADH-FMN oxidoreductase RutF